MAWYRCMGDNSTGMSTLVAKPYNVVNGNYSINNNIIIYNIIPASGYEGMSVQLVNLEVGQEYLITFDVTLAGLASSFMNYSWKCGIKDGTLTSYSGDYGNATIYDDQVSLPKTNDTKKSFGMYVKPQSEMTTLYFCTAAANNNLTLTINNFKCVKTDVDRESKDISEIVRLTESEWSNLQSKDNNKLYLVCNDHKDMVRKQFQGNRRILRERYPENYDIYYEDLYFPGDLNTGTGSYVSADQYAFDTDIYPFSIENSSRSFEVTFNVEPHLSQNYGNILALHTYQSGYVGQIYVHNTNNIYGFGIALQSSSDVYRHLSDITNKDVRIVVDKTNLEVKCYVDDVLVNTSSFTNFTYDSPFRIGLYATYSPFNGKMNYVSFRWLD